MSEPNTSTPLVRAMAVMQAVASSLGGIRYSNLSKEVGLPRSTAYRIAQTLIDIGFLQMSKEGDRLYIGSEIVKIAFRGSHPETLEEVWCTRLTALADKVGEAVFLARLQGPQVEIIGVYPPRNTDLGGHVYPGRGLRPPHACSSAKAILAFQDDDLIEQALLNGLKPFTQTTLQDRDLYMSELSAIRSQGYAECRGEMDEDIYSLAVPVAYGTGRVEICIGVVGTSARISNIGVERLVEEIKKCTTIHALISESSDTI